MPLPEDIGPRCPACHAAETECQPFTRGIAQLPIYACLMCGLVWTEDEADSYKQQRQTISNTPARNPNVSGSFDRET